MLVSAHMVAMAAIATFGAFMEQPLGSDWQVVGDGNWKVLDNSPAVVWQGNGAVTTSAVVAGTQGTGNTWRCLIEPGVQAEKLGFWFNASTDLKSGFLLTLGGTPGIGGIELRDASGGVLWCDKYAPWVYYTPYLLEGIVEPDRVRVQMLSWNGAALLAQSDWLTVPNAQPADGKVMALYSEKSIARFSLWERADKPSMEIVPDSPTKMRLVSNENSEWVIVGDGDWRWKSPEKNRIRQGAQIDRSTAINKTLGGAEGTWRCRVNVDKDTCGAGMMMNVDDAMTHGFNVWLGGNYGAGGLMLYRMPGDALWSSPQDTWHYNTEYVLEGTIAAGKVSVRMLAADGTTVLAESPAFDLTAEEKGRPGYIGFMAWQGKAEFWDFSDATRASSSTAALPAPESTPVLADGWRAVSGTWKTSETDGKKVLEQAGVEGSAVAINEQARAAKGVFRARVLPQEGVQSVSLMFQVSADLQQGFECRLGQGAFLHCLDGRDLWKRDDFQWQKGKAYILEGVVVTDRVSLRISDEAGNVLLQSDECYVSDRNNTREGLLGFKVEGGPVQFSDWSVQATE